MKRVLHTILILVIFSSGMLKAQGGAEGLESLKIAHISKELKLTPQEAEKFWPVYNGYENDMKKMVREHKEKGGSEIELEEKILGMHKKYRPDFLKVISEQKFDRLMVAERSWREMLQRELKRRKEGGGKKPGQLNY